MNYNSKQVQFDNIFFTKFRPYAAIRAIKGEG